MSGQAPAPLRSPFTTLKLETEDATRQLAEDLAVILRSGDTVLLSGDLGTGKSTLSRALLRSLAGDPELEVPSPTFTLVQTYRLDRLEVAHFDLYRLEEPEEVEELGLAEELETGAALIEWPEMAADLLPENALWLQLTETGEVGPDGEAVRTAAFQSVNPDWQKRVQRTLGLRRFLDENDYPNASRFHIAGDASTRNFEQIVLSKKTAILMDWPEPEGAAATPEALAYNALVHRALDCRSFVAVAGELRRRGFGAAGVLASSVANGMLLLEDLGSEGIVDGKGAPLPDRYHAAMRVLVRLHSESLPQNVPLSDGGSYHVPDYSLKALLTEAELYVDWFAPDKLGRSVSDDDRQAFRALWTVAINEAQKAECSWVLRDVHSPNILWQQDKDGDDRVGLIDLQDTVWGPVAYDVASVALDARVDVSEELEKQLLMTYFEARQQANPEFDRVRFEAAYAIMAAQRLTKILGIFVRLAKRDGKTGYLVHAPRLIGYMDRVLQHPSLAGLKDWFEKSGLFLKRTGE